MVYIQGGLPPGPVLDAHPSEQNECQTGDQNFVPPGKKSFLTFLFTHLDEKEQKGFAMIFMEMFISRHLDLYVWQYCKENFLLVMAIPKSICVSLRIFDMGPMRKYASFLLFLMQTRFISLEMAMDEYNFVYTHTSVVDAVVSTKCLKEIIGKLKLWSFAKKNIYQIVDEENPDSNIPDPSTSGDVPVDKPKSKRKATPTKGKGRGKSSAKIQVLQPVPVPVPMGMIQKSDMTTQTDSDFEEFLQITEDEFEEYKMYKEMKLRQQYLVNTIQEEDFAHYDID